MRYKPYISPVYREWVATQQREQVAAEAEREQHHQENSARWKRMYKVCCLGLGYTLGILFIVVIALTGAFDGVRGGRR